MTNIILAFLIGCTFTYLITVISSAIKAASILEDATYTYALLFTVAYEAGLEEIELRVFKNKLEEKEANILRSQFKKDFAKFVNGKIQNMLKFIPLSHKNIVRYENFEELKKYIEQKHRR
jgi:archaellin